MLVLARFLGFTQGKWKSDRDQDADSFNSTQGFLKINIWIYQSRKSLGVVNNMHQTFALLYQCY